MHTTLLLFRTSATGMQALLLAIAGGAAMGVYPAFIKTPSVLAADVHPVVFQCYK